MCNINKYYKKGGKNLELGAKKRFLINFLYLLVVGGIIVIVCRFLLFRMFPFLLSLIVAAVSQKPSTFLSGKTGIKKSNCAMFLAAGIYLGVFSLLVFLAYRLIISSAGLIEYLPKLFSAAGDFATRLENLLSNYLPSDYNISFTSLLENVLKNYLILVMIMFQLLQAILIAVIKILKFMLEQHAKLKLGVFYCTNIE
jgi:hypothetical protein